MSGDHVRTRNGPRRWVIAVICGVVLAIAAGGFVAVDRQHSNQAAATPSAPPPALTVDSVSPTGANVAAGSTVTAGIWPNESGMPKSGTERGPWPFAVAPPSSSCTRELCAIDPVRATAARCPIRR